jgi:hypothetical protein
VAVPGEHLTGDVPRNLHNCLVTRPAFGQLSDESLPRSPPSTPSNWTQNGTLTAGSGGLTSSNTNGGSLISKVSVPDGTSDYEVKTTLTLTQSGGTYVTYLRATSNAMSGPALAGTTYAFEIQNPTFSGPACTATLASYKIISGAATALGTTSVPCSSTTTVRAVYTAIGNQIAVYVNNGLWFYASFKSPYRKCFGPSYLSLPRNARRSTPDQG